MDTVEKLREHYELLLVVHGTEALWIHKSVFE